MDSVDWNGRMEWWNGLDWNGMECPEAHLEGTVKRFQPTLYAILGV